MIFIPMAAVSASTESRNKLSPVYRVILLIPAMIPAPLIFVLWKWMYNEYIGPINYILTDVLGIFTIQNQPQWMSNPLVFPSLAFMEWWWGLGYHTMFFLAGLGDGPARSVRRARG